MWFLPYRPSPVTKDSLKKFPILGTIALFGKCIFVKRENEEDRKNSIEKINQRALNVQ